MLPPPPTPTLFPYTTLFRSQAHARGTAGGNGEFVNHAGLRADAFRIHGGGIPMDDVFVKRVFEKAAGFVLTVRSEEHTSELQSHHDLVCRLLLEKKKKKINK